MPGQTSSSWSGRALGVRRVVRQAMARPACGPRAFAGLHADDDLWPTDCEKDAAGTMNLHGLQVTNLKEHRDRGF